MASQLRRWARRWLAARYDPLVELYQRRRQAAETLIRPSNRFTPITLADFAAGQAALEAA